MRLFRKRVERKDDAEEEIVSAKKVIEKREETEKLPQTLFGMRFPWEV